MVYETFLWWRQAHAAHRHCRACPASGDRAVALSTGRDNPAGGAAQTRQLARALSPTAQDGASMRIEGQRARNGSGLPAGDRPYRWGALVMWVWTQRFARMWYVVTGLVPARIEV